MFGENGGAREGAEDAGAARSVGSDFEVAPGCARAIFHDAQTHAASGQNMRGVAGRDGWRLQTDAAAVVIDAEIHFAAAHGQFHPNLLCRTVIDCVMDRFLRDAIEGQSSFGPNR